MRSEQENAYHGDSRSGVPRAGHCATAIPSLRHQAGEFGPRPLCVRIHQHIIPGEVRVPSPAVLALSGWGLLGVPEFPLLCGMEGIGPERGGMDARKRDDTNHRGRGGHYIGHSPTAGTLGSFHSPGPIQQVVLCRVTRDHSSVYIRHCNNTYSYCGSSQDRGKRAERPSSLRRSPKMR